MKEHNFKWKYDIDPSGALPCKMQEELADLCHRQWSGLDEIPF